MGNIHEKSILNFDQWFRKSCHLEKMDGWTEGRTKVKDNYNSSPVAFGSGELNMRARYLHKMDELSFKVIQLIA